MVRLKWIGLGIVTFLAVLLVPRTGIAATTGSSESVFANNAPVVMDLGAGILVGGGDALPGLDVRIKARLNTATPLYLGAEAGTFIFSGPGSAGAIIPLLGTFSTQFDLTNRIHPVAGISAGPALATGGGYSSARFAVLLDPGFIVDLQRNMALTALVRFGAIGSTFVVLPQVGLLFAI